jgi:23S rRNA (uracil1939-C5)-methyltransferase
MLVKAMYAWSFLAVEVSEEAIAALNRAVSQVPADSVQVELADAYAVTGDLLRDTGAKTLVADPPRRGLGEALIQAIDASNVERLVFLSCQPAVLERDLPLLEKAGFRLSALSIVDQFPGTVHVETVALLERNQD